MSIHNELGHISKRSLAFTDGLETGSPGEVISMPTINIFIYMHITPRE
jgi:hypothetical protein